MTNAPINSSYFKSKSFYVLIVFAIILISVRIIVFKKELDAIKISYIQTQEKQTLEITSKIEDKLKTTYETIRTISLLPGVRNLSSNKNIIKDDTEGAIQQLYNNAYTNVQLSELYLLTKENQIPIATFDDFITSIKSENISPYKTNHIEEVEDFEHEVQDKQKSFLLTNYPSYNFSDLKIPMVISHEIITCDNSDFSREDLMRNDNKKRMGIVLTVPTYDNNNHFSGAVSAILKTTVIESYIKDNHYGLVNKSNDTVVIKSPTPDWKKASIQMSKGNIDNSLIYSKIVPIKTMDLSSWQLWVALPNSEFYNTDEYKDLIKQFITELAIAFFVIFFMYFMQRKVLNDKQKIELINHELKENRIALKKDNHLLQVLSHDVSNTLTVIAARIKQLHHHQQHIINEESKTKCLKITNNLTTAADSALQILNHVKELKALESGRMKLALEPTNIDEAFRVAVVLFDSTLKDKNIQLSLIDSTENTKFLCHKATFCNSVFNNFISNAIKFSPNGSVITITVQRSGDSITISIKDNGIGIPEELSKVLFNDDSEISRTGTNGEKGTGFGLGIAKSYIEHYQGSLDFSTQTTGETGTTFNITLKVA